MKHNRIRAIATAFIITCGAALLLCLVGCSGSSSSSSSSASSASASASTSYTTEATGAYASGTHHAKVTVKGYDPFTIELDADAAPVTVSNFCFLASDGFYDGLTFHRIVEGFCLQGGDPSGIGTGSTGTPIVGEFSANGIQNALADSFERGTVAMARTTDPNSATCQFFITLASSQQVSQSLDGQYAAFGTVNSSGMDIVGKIVDDYAKKATGQSGTIPDTSDQPTITSIKIED